jgi:hypothetical protein
MKRSLLLGFAFAWCLASLPAANHITNGTLTLEYESDPDVGLLLTSFEYAGQSEAFDLHDPSWDPRGIWKLELCDPLTHPKQIIEISPEHPDCTFNFRTMGSWPPNTVNATWSQVTFPGVAGSLRVMVTISIPPGGDAAEFTIRVWNDSTSHSLFSHEFPRLNFASFAADPATERLALAAGGGINVEDPIHSEIVALDDYGTGDPGSEWYMLPFRHPTGMFPMQMWAYYDESQSAPDVLFGGTRDTEWILKDFLFDPPDQAVPPDPDYLRTSVRTVLPDNLTIGNDLTDPLFPFVLSAFEAQGSDAWYDAARFYREWALANLPDLNQPIEDNPDFSDVFRNAKMYSTYTTEDGDPSNFLYWGRDIVDQRTYFDVDELPGHVYNWHNNPFGENWGDWWPPHPQYLFMVPQIVALGFGHAPYILLNCYDSEVASFYDPYVRGYDDPLWEWIVKDLDGNYVGGGDAGAQTICPATPFFHDYVHYCITRLATPRESDAMGVYLDVWTGSNMHHCYASNHDHAPGGGSYWIQGMVDAMHDARAYVRNQMGKEEFYVTTEADNESFDGEATYGNYIGPYAKALVLLGEGAMVPLFATVFGDCQKTGEPMTTHVQDVHPDEAYLLVRRWLASNISLGRMPWAGSELGLNSIYDNMEASQTGYEPCMEMTQRFMDVLEGDPVRACVHFGERMRNPVTDAVIVDPFLGDYKIPYRHDGQPVVYTACFRKQDESAFGILFLNWTWDQDVLHIGGVPFPGGDQTVEYTFDPAEVLATGDYQVRVYTPGGMQIDQRTLGSPYTATQVVPERTAVFVEFVKL